MKATRALAVQFKSRYGPFLGGKQGERFPAGVDIPVTNPATGEVIATVTSASKELVDYAVLQAHETYRSGVWSKASPYSRSLVLTRMAHALEENMDEFVRMETLQTGRALREMKAQIGRLPEWLHYYAGLLRTRSDFIAPTQGTLLNYVNRVPLGVVAQITPFNHPLFIAMKKIAPGLAAGNSVVVKPSELAPITVLEFADMAHSVGLPEGVLTVLPGYGHETGKDLAVHPLVKKVDITAGTKTGKALGGILSSNLTHYTAELGGKAPIVVFNDADLKCAVDGAAFAAFIASGQTCVSGTRIIIQDGIYDEFISAFTEKVQSITRRIGNPSNPQSCMGTVISEKSLERIIQMVNGTSGNILVGGTRMTGLSPLDQHDLSKGSFYSPTIITDIDVEDELWKEEIFGPVVVVKKFSSEQEGIDLANNCKYGLGAGIWTTDLSKAHRVAAEIEAGLVWVNAHHRNDPSSPWGGMKDSGIGRENGVEAYEAYTQSKSIIVNFATIEETQQVGDWFSEGESAKRYG